MSPMKTLNRAAEALKIKAKRTTGFKNIIGGSETETCKSHLELTFKEFVIISTMHHLNFYYISGFIDLILNHGSIAVGFTYIILTALLGMPLSMLFTFMSSYSRKSYLAFWDCVPLFEGIGYSVAIIRFTSECYNVLIAATSFSIITDIFKRNLRRDIWNCNFDYGDTICIPMSNTKPIINCTGQQFNTATQSYFRFQICKYSFKSHWVTPVVNMKLLTCIGFTWCLVFLLAILGLHRLRKITVHLQIIFACVMTVIVVLILVRVDFNTHKWTGSHSHHKIDFKFWVEIIIHAAETTVLGNLIWLGTMKPACLDPKYAAIITTPIKLLVLILIVCVTTVITQENRRKYNVESGDCLQPIGTEVLQVFLPDMLFRSDLWQTLTVLWYSSVYFFAALAVLYSVVGLVDSITEKFNKLRKYSVIVSLLLCMTGFCVSILLATSNASLILVAWRYCGLTVLSAAMSVIINFAIFFVYSTRKIIDDYIFAYGAPPEQYWVVLWKSAPIFSIFSFIFAITFQTGHFANAELSQYVMLASYLQSGSFLLPIFIIFIRRMCTNIKQRTVDYLSKPSPDWGPYDQAEKIARTKFFPQRDVKYRNPNMKCKHKCVLSTVAKHVEEIDIQVRKFNEVRKEMMMEMEEQEKNK